MKTCGNDYSYKRTSIGTKIFSPSMEKYKDLIEKLDKQHLSFHTFRARDRGTFKMIIAGLPQLDKQIVENDLKSQGVEFISLSEIVTKRTTADDALYIVQFKRNAVTKNMLRDKIRFIQKVAITWKNSYPKKNGPTQCTKCSMYGHGAENLHRINACILCASTEHKTEDCRVNVFTCRNCTLKGYAEANHRADDPRCPCRAEYINARNNAMNKNARNQRPNRSQMESFIFNEAEFPQAPLSQNISGRTAQSSNPIRPSYSAQLRSKPQTSELFTTDELFDIFQDAMSQLSKCQTKDDQLRVIMGLLKYAYP